MRSRHMNHVLPATGLRAVIVRLRATKPQKFGFLRHCERARHALGCLSAIRARCGVISPCLKEAKAAR